MNGKLFPIDLPDLQWSTFRAEGFDGPAVGAIFRPGQASCGLPLGGIGTGCVDLDTDGTLGRCSIFNTFVPHRVLGVPFLALSVGSSVRALTTRQIPGTMPAKQIHYWGHYPIADLEFEIDGPVEAALRAWSPFFPGDAASSNTPAACFEVHLRNQSTSQVSGSLLFTFPGPSDTESGGQQYEHLPINGIVQGVHVTTTRGNGYILGVQSEANVHVGDGHLSNWAGTGNEIPPPDASAAGATLKVDYTLNSGEEKTFPVILAWYFPRWAGSAAHHFRHAYVARFRDACAVAEHVAANRILWLARILRWQSEIYAEEGLPLWLRDQLVNILHTIPEDSFWAGDTIPTQGWYTPTGIFGLTESPRTTPHICNPSDWYGGLPMVFFFPELAASLLRAYAHFQLPTGEVPLGIGEGADLEKAEYQVLPVMNSMVHAQLVDRLWQRDLSASVLQEFYPSVKQALEYTHGLDRDGDGLPDLDPDPIPNHYYGNWPWYGAAIHVSGLWLATLSMVERMAKAIGDSGFALDCKVWFETASRSLERKLWNGEWYRLYYGCDGKSSDTILANQLAGQLCADLHGLPSIVKADRAEKVVTTVKQRLVPATPYGVVNALRPDGTLDTSGSPHSDGIFTGECVCVAMSMGYSGDATPANEIAERQMHNIVFRQGAAWDMPNIVHSITGEILHGHDFYQMMILWGLPLALSKQSIHQACQPKGLIGRVLGAARETPH